jgi:hypothetical protein
MSDESMAKAEVYVVAYLALQREIGVLEAKADEARAAVAEALRVEGEAPGRMWAFEGLGSVQVVKGRVSEKLDRARLARAGVAADVLDAATVRTEGKPSMRISAWREGDGDAAA